MNTIEKQIESQFGGVYLLLDNDEIVYVGESSNVPYRLNQHVKQAIKNFDSYKVYFCHDRKRLESELIQILHPKYNVKQNEILREDVPLDCGKCVRDEIDKVVDIIQKRINYKPIICRNEDLSRIFSSYTRNYKFLRVLEKYNVILGEDEFGYFYDLEKILYLKEEIECDLVNLY